MTYTLTPTYTLKTGRGSVTRVDGELDGCRMEAYHVPAHGDVYGFYQNRDLTDASQLPEAVDGWVYVRALRTDPECRGQRLGERLIKSLDMIPLHFSRIILFASPLDTDRLTHREWNRRRLMLRAYYRSMGFQHLRGDYMMLRTGR